MHINAKPYNEIKSLALPTDVSKYKSGNDNKKLKKQQEQQQHETMLPVSSCYCCNWLHIFRIVHTYIAMCDYFFATGVFQKNS